MELAICTWIPGRCTSVLGNAGSLPGAGRGFPAPWLLVCTAEKRKAHATCIASRRPRKPALRVLVCPAFQNPCST